MDATYREIVEWTSEMDRVRGLLQLARTAFPAPSTLYRSFERVPMSIWRGFLHESATICDPGSHGAIDATFFDHETASRHYQHRPDRHVRTLKTTALVDTNSCAILDHHCSAYWPHDTQTGRQVALRNTGKSRVSPATRAMTTNRSGTPSVQRASGPCCVIRCVRSRTQYTVGQRAIRPALDGRDLLFGHQASVRPRCPPSRVVPRVPRVDVDRCSLQSRTGSQTVIPARSSDSTKQTCRFNSSNCYSGFSEGVTSYSSAIRFMDS